MINNLYSIEASYLDHRYIAQMNDRIVYFSVAKLV